MKCYYVIEYTFAICIIIKYDIFVLECQNYMVLNNSTRNVGYREDKHDEHFRIYHSEERSFSCEYCDYRGKTKKFLDSHMLCHKEPKHECPHCGKMFRQISSFKHHIMTHTGEKPYHCQECSFKCIQPYDLTKHYSKTHGMIIKNPGSFRQNYTDQ